MSNATALGDTVCPSLLVSVAVPLYPVAMLPYGSWAVTVTVNPVPAVSELGALIENEVAAAGSTIIPSWPDDVTDPAVALRVASPALSSVAFTVATPGVPLEELKETSLGDTVCPSLVSVALP